MNKEIEQVYRGYGAEDEDDRFSVPEYAEYAWWAFGRGEFFTAAETMAFDQGWIVRLTKPEREDVIAFIWLEEDEAPKPELRADWVAGHGDAIHLRRWADGPNLNTVGVCSVVGQKGIRPLVEMSLPGPQVQITPTMAGQLALELLRAAEAAASDALMVKFLTEKAGLDMSGASGVLLELRGMREAHYA